MNDFLQLQTRNMAPYIFATRTICIITMIAAAVISWHAIRVMKREDPHNEYHTLGRGGTVFICFFIAFVIECFTIMIVPAIGDAHSMDAAYDRNMQMVQSAYNIRDVRQNARTSGDALHTTVQAGRNSEQNINSIRDVLAGDGGSATVTAITNSSDNIGHYIFRSDGNHRLRVYQDTKDGLHLITPAVQNHAKAAGAIVQSSAR